MEIGVAGVLRCHPISHAGATVVIYSLQAAYFIWVYRPCIHCTARDMIVLATLFSFIRVPRLSCIIYPSSLYDYHLFCAYLIQLMLFRVFRGHRSCIVSVKARLRS